MVVDERRRMADLLETLTAQQLQQPSLCAGWTVHDIAAHLTTYLWFGQMKLYLGMAVTLADFEEINRRLTRRAARRPDRELTGLLRRRATARTTIPRSGYDPVLADIVLHDLDVRVPLGLPRHSVEEHMWVAFRNLTATPAPGFNIGSRLEGLRLVATDTGWTSGEGAPVRGTVEALLLGIGGRRAAFRELDGDGMPLLRMRSLNPPERGPVQRLRDPVRVLLNAPPRERRSRRAVEPPRQPTVFDNSAFDGAELGDRP
jgi:uncharacterized protein (TIGR03083 family)